MIDNSNKSSNEYCLSIPDSQLHEFWRHFQGAGNQVKQNMISTVTWVLALALGVLGFLVGKLHMFGKVLPSDLPLAQAIAILGFVICVYVLWIIYEFGKAMEGNWKRADKIGEKLAKTEGLKVSIKSSKGVPNICMAMYFLTGGLAVTFMAGLLHLVC